MSTSRDKRLIERVVRQVHAAANAVQPNDSYISAETVCQLLHQLAELKLGVPITIFLDNARYQTRALVLETAAKLQIELCFLRTYSPNLNLIERLWKFVKKQCLYFQIPCRLSGLQSCYQRVPRADPQHSQISP